MAKVTKNTLLENINNSNPGNSAGKRQGYYNTMENLVDSVSTTEAVSGLTVSESANVTIPLLQPPGTIIEDIVVVCTSDASYDSALLGFRAGTTEGGVDIVAGTSNSFSSTATSLAAGKGISTVTKLRTALGGNADITTVANSGYTSTPRILYAQVSQSAGAFDTNTGEFTAVLKYIKL